MRFVPALALAAATPILAAAPLLAQQMPATPGAPDRTRVTAGTYTVDSGHTQVLFTVMHMGFSRYTGQFTQPTGTMTLDPANLGATKLDISFPIDKVSTTVPALDAHLKKADFFDTEKYPQGRFVATQVVAKGNSATITGDLTLKGVTKPVTMTARFVGAGLAPMGEKRLNIGFAATATIKRSDFGISYGVPMVSDAVDLTINAAFEKQ